MNISDIKSSVENRIVNILKENLQGEPEIQAFYSLDTATVNVEIHKEFERINNSSSILIYNLKYEENTDELTAAVFNRVFVYDSIGVAIANNEIVPITDSFLTGIKALIKIAMSEPEENAKLIEEE